MKNKTNIKNNGAENKAALKNDKINRLSPFKQVTQTNIKQKGD